MSFNAYTYLARQYRLTARAKIRKARTARAEGDTEAVGRLVMGAKRDLRAARRYRNEAAK